MALRPRAVGGIAPRRLGLSAIGGLLLAHVLSCAAAQAHDAGPLLYVDISEIAPNAYTVAWKVPDNATEANVPTISLPASCRPAGPVAGAASVRRQVYNCSGDLSDEAVVIDYPQSNASVSTLMHFKRLSGETYAEVLGPEKTAWTVPAKERIWRVAGDYTVLGVEHILSGYDHLLFIVCLLLLAGSFRRVAITITGFTIAHSITLCLAALDLVRLPAIAVEANIALSILFVASELARSRRDTLTWRYPIAVSTTFGLLHGFGFAAALSGIGLPQTELPAALFFFNVGVEIGQLMFVIAAVTLFYGVRRLVPKLRGASFQHALSALQQPAAYLVGSLATFWTIDRLSSLWS